MYKKLSQYALFTGILLSFFDAQSQSIEYPFLAGKFSQTSISGTAASMARGGTNVALGADMGSAMVNPAGFGLYRKSEYILTPSLQFGGSETNFTTPDESSTWNNNKDNFNINNFGIVMAYEKDILTDDEWKGGAFAITFNRTNNFHRQYSYEGQNSGNSLRNHFIEQMNGTSSSVYNNEVSGNILQELAYASWLINSESDINGGSDQIYMTFNDGDPVVQSELVTEKGAQYEWGLSYGANYNDKLYLGAGLGVATTRYIRESQYTESVVQSIVTGDSLLGFTLSDKLETRGVGVNFKAGFIYRMTDHFRVGGSFQSPTYYGMSEDYEASIVANYNNIEPYSGAGFTLNTEEGSRKNVFDYNLVTPFRFSGGIAVIGSEKWFIAGDLEYVLYNRARLSADGVDFNNENQAINNLYKPALNVRIGAEYRGEMFRLRGGIAHYGDSFDNLDNINRSQNIITGGVGFIFEDFYLDMTLMSSIQKSGGAPYSLSNGNQPTYTTKNNTTSLLISVGAYF